MLNTVEKVFYKAFGFNVISEILLPELPILSNTDNSIQQADVSIIIADLSEKWAELAEHNRYFVVKENLVMFQVQNTATFSIEDGNKIIVSPKAQMEIEEVVEYYFQLSNLVPVTFIEQLEEAYSSLSKNPYYRIRQKNFRTIPIKGFPFLLFF